MDFDATQLGNVLAGILGTLAVGIPAGWATIQKMRRQLADNKAEIAEAKAARGAADADNKVYTRIQSELDRLYDRLKNLDHELAQVRAELDTERRRSYQLELRLAQLDGFIRSKGLEPPTVTWTPPPPAGGASGSSPPASAL